jgi:hypothetical protein
MIVALGSVATSSMPWFLLPSEHVALVSDALNPSHDLVPDAVVPMPSINITIVGSPVSPNRILVAMVPAAAIGSVAGNWWAHDNFLHQSTNLSRTS